MKQVILIPDSFKGSLSSPEICQIMKRRILGYYPDCRVLSLPVADGGEGSVDCFLSGGGEKIRLTVDGPFFKPMESFYGLMDSGKTAVIEMAACSGLPLVEGCANPALTTTFGVGQMMLDAVKRGCKRLILCLGGSCTNDMGAGAAAACGIHFLDSAGREFVPVGGTLQDVAKIDSTGLAPELHGVEIVTMCDIDSPLYGETGAAYVFAPQKGADPAMVKLLDFGLRRLCSVVQKCLGEDVSTLPGGGAAGGMGAGMRAFFGSELKMGIQVVLEQFRFDDLLSGTDLVFTGEGRLDSQSLRGKVVIGVAQHAKSRNVPVVAVVGDIGDNIEPVYEEGVCAVFSINRVAKPFSEVRGRSAGDLDLTMDSLLRLYGLKETKGGYEACRN